MALTTDGYRAITASKDNTVKVKNQMFVNSETR